MTSTMRKNALPSGLLRSMATTGLEFWIPPEDADGIATAQNVTNGQINIDGALVRNLVTNRMGILPRAAGPYFTFSQTTDRCDIKMTGLNQWGEKVEWNLNKGSAGTVQKTLLSNGADRIPPMLRIDTIEILNVTVGTGTVSVGFNYSTGNANTISLPLKLANVSDVISPAATRSVYMSDMDGLWGGGPWPNFASVATIAGSKDLERGCLGITTGSTAGISQSAATFTNTTRTLTKTGAFATLPNVAGTPVVIVSGTGVTTGTYYLAAKVSSDAIILDADIGGANPVDVVFTIQSSPTKWGRGFLVINPDLLVVQ